MLDNALGLYLVTWALVTFIFVLACLRSSIALITVFVCLDITFWLLAAGYLGPSTKCTTAGGAFGLVRISRGPVVTCPIGDLSR
ncbi:hypothetical protein C370_07326 [Cryptococcus neoformans A1-35-8]|nr:hypothetical protein C370_07326 [Cryptococcus neoformans var. grubii A1-35-8]